MEAISALLVDDEAPARRLLGEMLGKHPEIEVVGEAASGDEALERIRELSPRVVFLDVQMPEKDGLAVARELVEGSSPVRVVFVTAYDEFAVRAFELEAVDYLLKPVDPQRLARTAGRLAKPASEATALSLLRALERVRETCLDRLSLLDERSGVRHVVELGAVDWITCRGEKTYVHTGGGSFAAWRL